MDCEKYYMIGSDRYYSVHFFDTQGLSMDKIKDIFSSYGNVVTIKIGEKPNLRFVKYKTLDETIRCIKGLQNSKIRLLLQKNKINGSDGKMNENNSSQQRTARMENSSQKTFNTSKQFNPTFVHNEKMSDIGERSIRNMKIFNGDKIDNADDFSDTNSRNSKHNHKANPNVTKYDKFDSSVSNEKYSLSSKQQNSTNCDSANITMNYEKYYRISKDGTHTVHFPNKKGLSNEEIKELFSPYGNVISVHSGGDNNGLRFVRYKTSDEIIRCLKGLQNSKVINILPQKNKINSTIKKTEQKSLNQWQMTENSSEKADKQFNSGSVHGEEKPTCNTKSDWDNFSDSRSSQSSKYNCNTKLSETNHNELNLPIFNRNYSVSRQENSTNKVLDYNQIEKQQKMKSYFSTKPNTNTHINKNMFDNKIPTLISDTEIKQKEFDAMSDSSSVGNKNTSTKIIVIPMQEIIVANIHEKYGIHYILHLFEKYNPISATLMSTSETNIRFCRVYFKTIQDVIAVEEEFDNFDLSGKNLIVLRQSQLIKEAFCE